MRRSAVTQHPSRFGFEIEIVRQHAADHPAPACIPAIWQREPLKVSFQASGAPTVSFDLVGTSAVLVEDGDGNEEPASAAPAN